MLFLCKSFQISFLCNPEWFRVSFNYNVYGASHCLYWVSTAVKHCALYVNFTACEAFFSLESFRVVSFEWQASIQRQNENFANTVSNYPAHCSPASNAHLISRTLMSFIIQISWLKIESTFFPPALTLIRPRYSACGSTREDQLEKLLENQLENRLEDRPEPRRGSLLRTLS